VFGGNSITLESYAEAREFCDTRRKRKLANNTWLHDSGDSISVCFHSTFIVNFYPGSVTLNSGGWRTLITKERINWYLPSGKWDSKAGAWVGMRASVWQTLGQWYLTVKLESGLVTEYDFVECITLHDNGKVTCPANNPLAVGDSTRPATVADPKADAREYRRERRREVKRRKAEGYVWGGRYRGWRLEDSERHAYVSQARAAEYEEQTRAERFEEIERRIGNVLAEANEKLPFYNPR